MGNKNSVANTSQEQETQQHNDQNNRSSDISGVFLAQNFQEEIVQTFQSKAIQKEFELFQAKMITSHNETVSRDDQQRQVLQRDLNTWREGNAQMQTSLDERIDAVRAKFSDTEVGFKYDLGKMEETMKKKARKLGNTENACINSRNELARCFNEVKDVRICDGFVEALERCAQKMVTSS